MNWLSQTDAALALGFFSSCVVPYTYAWMKAKVLPDSVKFIIIFVVCTIGGFLTAYVGGALTGSLSLIQFASVVGAAGFGIYVTVFQKLGLERVIFPRASVITEAQKSVAAQIGMMSQQTINSAVNPESTTAISVRAESIQHAHPQADSVLPKG